MNIAQRLKKLGGIPAELRDRAASMMRRMALAAAYDAVFNNPDGQLVLRDLCKEGGLLEVAYMPGDVAGTHFNDGKRALVLHILERLRWSPGELMQVSAERTTDALDALDEQEAA